MRRVRIPGAGPHGRRALIAGGLSLWAGRAARADGMREGVEADLSWLDGEHGSHFLPAGCSRFLWHLSAQSIGALGVFGPPEALFGLRLNLRNGGGIGAALSSGPLDEDGLLPRVVALRTGPEPVLLEGVVDVRDPVELRAAEVPDIDHPAPSPKGLANGEQSARPLVPMPAPRSAQEGYVLAVAVRYLFLRVDVVQALLVAFERTFQRFRSDPIFVGDSSQWNGKRPKTDLAQPRHISHDGGVDVDLGLPAADTFPSSLRDHCRGVRLEPDRFGCSPGTAKGVDFERLAYLLGMLVDEAPCGVVKIYIDDVYRREVVRIVPSLFERRWLKEGALAALSDDGIMVASPWHTDHVHVRFGGEKATSVLS